MADWLVQIGVITIVWGFVVLWLLPDDPIRSKFLTERERYIAIERLRGNQAGVTSKIVKPKQALAAFADVKVILLSVVMFCLTCPSGAVGSFSPLVLQRVYGATASRTLLLLMPSATVGGVCALIAGYMSFYLRNARCFTIILFAGICLIGAALEWRLPLTDKPGILAGLYLMSSYGGALGVVTGLAVSNVAGATKKTVQGSLVFLSLALANIASREWRSWSDRGLSLICAFRQPSSSCVRSSHVTPPVSRPLSPFSLPAWA